MQDLSGPQREFTVAPDTDDAEVAAVFDGDDRVAGLIDQFVAALVKQAGAQLRFAAIGMIPEQRHAL